MSWCLNAHCLIIHNVESHLDKYIEAQAVDVVDVAQSEQAGEQAAGQHAHCQVQSDGKALPDDAAAWEQNDHEDSSIR